ncbi:MAG: hypothetical protein WC333_01155 [Dehalococcoidia bacterium]|jgi:hypothetical protein
MTRTHEEYLNLIKLLELALKFYADKNNYTANPPIHNTLYSPIELDKGSQAQFALDKIGEFEEYDRNLEEEYAKQIESLSAEAGLSQQDEIMKLYEKIREIAKNDDKNV